MRHCPCTLVASSYWLTNGSSSGQQAFHVDFRRDFLRDFRRDIHRDFHRDLHMESNAQTHYAPPIAAYAMNRRHVLDAIRRTLFKASSFHSEDPVHGTCALPELFLALFASLLECGRDFPTGFAIKRDIIDISKSWTIRRCPIF